MCLYTIHTFKGGLLRQLPSYGPRSWLAFPASYEPHHCVNQPSLYNQVVGKCNSSEKGEFTGENTLLAETLSPFG